MQFRPCIDLHQGKVKQIVGSSLKDADNSALVNFESSLAPASYAAMYRQDGLRGGHVIKLGAGNDQAAEEALAAWPGGLQMGGGITADNARHWLDRGAAQVIVTSHVFKDGSINYQNLERLVAVTGPERLVLDLSCKERDGQYFIVTDRWQSFTETVINARTLEALSAYCCEFLVHAASVEGKMAGPDLTLVELLAEHSPIPVVYAGGIATVDDIAGVRKAGRSRVHITIGSALDIFGGQLAYRDVVSLCDSDR